MGRKKKKKSPKKSGKIPLLELYHLRMSTFHISSTGKKKGDGWQNPRKKKEEDLTQKKNQRSGDDGIILNYTRASPRHLSPLFACPSPSRRHGRFLSTQNPCRSGASPDLNPDCHFDSSPSHPLTPFFCQTQTAGCSRVPQLPVVPAPFYAAA